MSNRLAGLYLLLLLPAIFVTYASAGHDNGLVAHYTFDEIQGSVVKDATGNGHDLTAANPSLFKTTGGGGLRADLMDFGDNKSLKTKNDMTCAFWLTLNAAKYPSFEENWVILTAEIYNQSGFMLRINGDSARLVYRSNQQGGNQVVYSEAPVRNNTLHHVVLTRKDGTVSLYIDGLPSGSGVVIDAAPDDMPLTIPRFPGVFEDLKVYDRALAPEEISRIFMDDAPGIGKPMWDLRVYPQSTGGTVAAEISFNPLLRPGSSAMVTVELRSPADSKPVTVKKTVVKPGANTAQVVFDTIGLKPGEYEVEARLEKGGRALPVSERFTWAGPTDGTLRAKDVKILNNLVMELLNVKGTNRNTGKWEFTLPFDSWVFVQGRGSGGFSISLDAMQNQPVISGRTGFAGTQEAMRYLHAGRHVLNAGLESGARLDNLVVRSIPELIYCEYPNNPYVTSYGPYDWEFLRKHVLANVNCMVVDPNILDRDRYRPNLTEWKSRGGRIILPSLIPRENVIETWASHPGCTHPLADGIIIDEFPAPTPKEAGWTEIIRSIYGDSRLKDKRFYAWSNGPFLYGVDANQEFTRLVMGLDGKFAMKFYLPNDRLTESAARDYVYSELHSDAVMWEKVFPGSMRSLILNLGYMSHPQESCNMNPSADFKVLMDMEMNILANDPAYRGLYGIAWYLAAYADEETVRWGSRLFRHYAIDGKKNMLSDELGYKYELRHVKNPDFAEGTSGWKIREAEPGSVETRELKNWSWLQGRFPPTPVGDTFLWTRRTDRRPNSFSQEIKNLKPGQLYSLKMFTADYQDIVNGISARKEHAVSIKIDNAEILPTHSVREAVTNNYAHFALGFQSRDHRAWMNYHWQVFRAKGKTATLTISDWPDDKSPGGPAGQELMYNFLQVQPYFSGKRP